MRIPLTSVMVDDQGKALRFYTEILGFVKKNDVPVGNARWLTVVSPDDPDGVELLLEPNQFPPARVYQQALFAAGIPLTILASSDIQADYDRLRKLGVVFHGEPVQAGPVKVAVFEDTCGNLIQLNQLVADLV